MQKNAKVFVAGHKGLVGSAILKNLQEKGFTNFVLKDHSELDLINQGKTRAFFEKEQPEYVFLAAAKVGGIAANNTYRADFIYENLMIQNNVIHYAYKTGVKKLLFLGSTCIYPKEANQPIKETELLTNTLEYTNEPYAIAKIAGIKMCESYNLQYGTNFISVMPTNLYGPNDNFDLGKSHVLPALIRKILLGRYLETNDWDTIRKDLNRRPIEGISGQANKDIILEILEEYGITPPHGAAKGGVEIWGSGKPKREFLWSEDMADACVFIMENVDFNDITPPLVRGEAERPGQEQTATAAPRNEIRNTHINIGSGEEISIAELAEMIKGMAGFKGQLHFNNTKPDGTMRKVTDVSKLKQLGWQHKVGLGEGIQKMINWYSL
ncbi:GDP-L-fucose synthetase [hydrothermal vent metagenome]|uniref:GDP-L-fucose synthetase n=1 Tax=hydrothermal vent metagenome TaxID=652676 RepID=A0A3B0TLC6_9ZZZZ